MAEKFVDHWPGLSQLLIDMKLMYCVLPIAMPDVGMMPVSERANLMLLTTCLDNAGAHNGDPEYMLLTTPFGISTVCARERSLVRNIVLYRHCRPRTLQYPMVSPKAISTWLFAGSPLSHMIPRSVPVIAKRLMVSLGLCGPVTQPTSAVPGGGPGAGGGAGPGAGAGGAGAAAAAASGTGGGGAGGATPACCCTRPDC